MKKTKWLAWLLIFPAIATTGCTSYNPVQLRQQQLKNNYSYYKPSPPLYAGDVVQLRIKNGSHDTITVQSITPQGLVTSTGKTIFYKEITCLKRKDISKIKTAAAVGVATTAVVIVTLYVVIRAEMIVTSYSHVFTFLFT